MNQNRSDGRTDLIRYCIECEAFEEFSIATAEEFLSGGTDVNFQSKTENDTALHWAARACRPDGVAFLLEKGAKINPINKTGETPLDTCAKHATDFRLRYSRKNQIEAKTPPPGFAQFF